MSNTQEKIYDQTESLKFQFKEGDNFVDDKERSDNLKQILMPKEKKPKLPQDYQIDMNQALYSLVEQDISSDGKVLKYIINQGQDDIVVDKSTIKVKFELRLQNGSLKDPLMTRSNIHRINLNSSKPIIKGLKLAFLSMKVGETSWFKISDVYNFTDDQELSEEKHSLILYYKIEMVQCQRPSSIKDNNKEDRIMYIQTIQAQGKELFKQNQFDQAQKLYQKGINYIDYWPKNLKNDPDTYKLIKDQRLLFVNNQVQCLIENRDCKEALKLLLQIKDQARGNPIELKTLYRLAKCYYHQEEYERSVYQLNEIEHLLNLNEDEQKEINLFKKRCNKKIRDEFNEFHNKIKKCKQ